MIRTIQMDSGRNFRLRVFADIEAEFKRHFDRAEEDETPPLYGSLWPSAEGLAHFLWRRFPGQSLKGQRILEVGCGLGLPSLICAAAGASVTAMDYHPGVGPLLAYNAQLNGLSPLRFALGSFADQSLELGRFDMIMGSDILYEPDTYLQLEKFLVRHAATHASIILADPGRFAVERFGLGLRAKSDFKLEAQMVPAHPHPIEIRTFQLNKDPIAAAS